MTCDPRRVSKALSLGCANIVDTGVDGPPQGRYARALTNEEKTKVAQGADKAYPGSDLIIHHCWRSQANLHKLISKAQSCRHENQGAVNRRSAAEGGGNLRGLRCPAKNLAGGGRIHNTSAR